MSKTKGSYVTFGAYKSHMKARDDDSLPEQQPQDDVVQLQTQDAAWVKHIQQGKNMESR